MRVETQEEFKKLYKTPGVFYYSEVIHPVFNYKMCGVSIYCPACGELIEIETERPKCWGNSSHVLISKEPLTIFPEVCHAKPSCKWKGRLEADELIGDS